jgi:hypothetical protein
MPPALDKNPNRQHMETMMIIISRQHIISEMQHAKRML